MSNCVTESGKSPTVLVEVWINYKEESGKYFAGLVKS